MLVSTESLTMETGKENFSATTLGTWGEDSDSADNEYYYLFHDTDYEDFSSALDILRGILIGCVFPFCVLGLAGNTLSVWVWNADKEHNTLVPLLQCLGVADCLYLLFSTVAWAIFISVPKHMLFAEGAITLLCLMFLAQTLSVHATMAIGIFRWMAVAKPQQMLKMKQRHVISACGGLGAWSCVITILDLVQITTFSAWSTDGLVMFVAVQIIGFIVPIVILLGFIIALVIIFRQHRRHAGKMQRRMTIAVLCIAGCTCMAYPVAWGINVVLLLQIAGYVNLGCSNTCRLALVGVRIFLQALNSSINFLIYYFFASKFRQVLRTNVLQWLSAVRNLCRGHKTSADISSPRASEKSRSTQGSREETEIREYTTTSSSVV